MKMDEQALEPGTDEIPGVSEYGIEWLLTERLGG
jgi:hypothetical protein